MPHVNLATITIIGNIAWQSEAALIALFAILGMAPGGTTILGWVAIAQIRHSAGRIYGLGLAVFDTLLFPLLALDGLIFWGWYEGLHRFDEIRTVGPGVTLVSSNANIAIVAGVLTATVLDWIIIRKTWRAVNKPLNGTNANPPIETRKTVVTPPPLPTGKSSKIKPPPTKIRAVIWYVLNLLPWLVILDLLCFQAPHLQTIFRDFHTEPPLLTRCVLALSELARTGFGIIAVPLLLLIPLPVLLLDLIRPDLHRNILRLCYRILTLMMGLFAVFIIVVGLAMPLTALIETVSTPTVAVPATTPATQPGAPIVLDLVRKGDLNIYLKATGSIAVVGADSRPFEVAFKIPRESAPPIVRAVEGAQQLPLQVFDLGFKRMLAEGKLSGNGQHFDPSDNRTDPITCVAFITPVVDDPFVNGEPVNIRVLLRTHHGSTLIPMSAVFWRGQDSYVYEVVPNQTTVANKVYLGQSDDESIEIIAGIAPRQTIIAQGVGQLHDGENIHLDPLPAPTTQPAPTKPSSGPMTQAATQPVQSVTCRMYDPKHPEQGCRVMMKSGHYRIERADGTVIIYDPNGSRMDLELNPKNKVAWFVDGQEIDSQRGIPVLNIGQLEKIAEPIGGEPVALLGRQQIAGRDADGIRFTHGFSFGSGASNETDTAWRDATTHRLVQFEIYIDRVVTDFQPFHIIYSDIVFDAPLDDSLFPTGLPPGYEAQKDPPGR